MRASSAARIGWETSAFGSSVAAGLKDSRELMERKIGTVSRVIARGAITAKCGVDGRLGGSGGADHGAVRNGGGRANLSGIWWIPLPAGDDLCKIVATRFVSCGMIMT